MFLCLGCDPPAPFNTTQSNKVAPYFQANQSVDDCGSMYTSMCMHACIYIHIYMYMTYIYIYYIIWQGPPFQAVFLVCSRFFQPAWTRKEKPNAFFRKNPFFMAENSPYLQAERIFSEMSILNPTYVRLLWCNPTPPNFLQIQCSPRNGRTACGEYL